MRAPLFPLAHVVVVAFPEHRLEPHAPRGIQEVVRAVQGIARDVEPVWVPALLHGVVVELLHPPRLQGNHVAGDALAAQVQAVVQHLAGVRLHVADEPHPERPAGWQRHLAGDLGVAVEDRGQVGAVEDVVIEPAARAGEAEGIGLAGAHVEAVPPGGVDEDAVAARAHEEGDGDVAADVAHPHGGAVAAVLDAVARLVAEAEEAFLFPEGEGGAEARVAAARRFDLAQQRLAGRPEELQAAGLALQADAHPRGAQAEGAGLFLDGVPHGRPVGAQETVALQAGLAEDAVRREAHAHDLRRGELHAQEGAIAAHGLHAGLDALCGGDRIEIGHGDFSRRPVHARAPAGERFPPAGAFTCCRWPPGVYQGSAGRLSSSCLRSMFERFCHFTCPSPKRQLNPSMWRDSTRFPSAR